MPQVLLGVVAVAVKQQKGISKGSRLKEFGEPLHEALAGTP
jgi:hypothetical protein